ncbi:uncharacterized protein CPUR_03199 [Claviceps purpurea 20.1]|uniref:F-box domain-containing protein n=1 Tax=Claviceps purpurea (strain 20.1) TaxID=1111077 RepID=M1W0I4_CLAP2|nr:uncharacterized protein CPUR_03199 [Claviceps purpurea 20.1]
MAGLIQSSRQSYVAATRKQKRALMLVTKAMRSCPCNKGVRRPRCLCKDFQEAAYEGYSIFEEAMHTCNCSVSEKFEKCYNMQHIKALHARSSMYEAMGKLDLAEDDAEWLLELAPRLPDGYLRLGNIARRNENDEYAWNLYTAGLEANKETPVGSSPKLKQLYDARKPLYWDFFRQDPLLLPPEIVTHIFSYLHFLELPVCLRVCKKWNSTLTRPPHCELWRNMVFPDGASPSLEYLEILQLKGLNFPSKEKIWNQLRRVSVESYGVHGYTDTDSPGGFPQTFLQNAASSLEHLDFVGIPTAWCVLVSAIPSIPNLKTLRIGHHDVDIGVDSHFGVGSHFGVYSHFGVHSNHENEDENEDDDEDDDEDDHRKIPLPIIPLAMAFPNLEQLCIGPDVPYLSLDISTSGQDKWEDIWPHLKVFIFDPITDIEPIDVAEKSRATLRYLTRLNSLQYLGLEVKSKDWPCMFSGTYHPLPDLDASQRSEFQNLRCFSSQKLCISPDGARTLLSNAIKANQLTSFDIVFPDGEEPDDHLKGYEWLRGCPSIQTLGCYRYRIEGRRYEEPNDDLLLLPQFLATFPNLRTLHIEHFSSWRTSEITRALFVILRVVTHLKTIYTSVSGDERLAQAARDQGVELITTASSTMPLPRYGARPRMWPIPLSAFGG